MAHAVWNRHNEAGLSLQRQYTVYCSVWGLFFFGQQAGASHSSCSNTPGGWPSRSCLPHPSGSALQPVRLTPCAWETGFLSFLRPVVQQGDSLSDSGLCGECRLRSTGRAVEMTRRSWSSSPPCNTRIQLRQTWRQRARHW